MSRADELKRRIIEVCVQKVNERIANAETAIEAAQESANSEEKSSAGDKYETSRAMGHRDRDMIARQLLEAKKDLNILTVINTDKLVNIGGPGALIHADKGYYFLAVGLGAIKESGIEFIALSPASPLGQAFKGKKKGDVVSFRDMKIIIREIS